MTNQLFEAALGINAPWYVQGVDFDAAKRQLTIAVDFVAGSRFAYPGVAGEHPVHDTQIKRLRRAGAPSRPIRMWLPQVTFLRLAKGFPASIALIIC